MKQLMKWNFVLAAFLLTTCVNNVTAQDVWKVSPNSAKLLCDTLGVKMIKVTWQPGEELPMHTHPAQQIYVLKGGQLTVNYKDGKTETLEVKDNDAMQFPSDPPHTSKNTGLTPLEVILVEIHKK